MLDWDDDESATLRRTLDDRWPESQQPPSDEGPPSIASAPPTRPEHSRSMWMSLSDWELEIEQWERESDQPGSSSAGAEQTAEAPPTIREPHRELSCRRPTLESEPPPTELSPSGDAERFDLRTTTKQLVVIPPGDVDEDDSPTVAATHSVSLALPTERSAATPSSIPPPPPAPRLASLAPVAMSSAPAADASHDELTQEIRHLRRRIRWSNRLSVVAVGCCALLGIQLWGASNQEVATQLEPAFASAPALPALTAGEPSQPQQGVKVSSAQPGVRLFVDDEDRGTLPVVVDDLDAGEHELRFQGSDQQRPLSRTITVRSGEVTDLGSVTLPAREPAEPAGRIQVKVRLLTPGATVCIAPNGEPARVLAGPFPRTLQLEPGSYAVLVSKAGRHSTVPLFLPPNRPERDVALRID